MGKTNLTSHLLVIRRSLARLTLEGVWKSGDRTDGISARACRSQSLDCFDKSSGLRFVSMMGLSDLVLEVCPRLQSQSQQSARRWPNMSDESETRPKVGGSSPASPTSGKWKFWRYSTMKMEKSIAHGNIKSSMLRGEKPACFLLLDLDNIVTMRSVQKPHDFSSNHHLFVGWLQH